MMSIKKEAYAQQRGFTLVELMIAIVVAAILIAIAVPSFTKQIQRSQMRGTVADFITAVAYARSQSVTRSTLVHVRSRDTVTATNWNSGWCVTTHATACGDASTGLLREFDGPSAITVTGNGSTSLYTFNSQGYLENNGVPTYVYMCDADNTGKKIEVLPLGQALAQDCTCATGVCN